MASEVSVVLPQATTPRCCGATRMTAVLPRAAALEQLVVVGVIGRGQGSEVLAAVSERALERSGGDASRVRASDAVALKLVRKQACTCEAAAREASSFGVAARSCGCATSQRLAHNELDVLRLLGQHAASPFLVQLRVWVETPTHLCLGLDYCPGGDLRHLMGQFDAFSPGTVRFFAGGILLALKHLHSLDILHSDVKPENVAIGADGYPKLLDFGLAAALCDERHQRSPASGRLELSTHSGTAAYCAPEVLLRAPHSVESDLWPVAIVMYEMAFGCLPWEHQDVSVHCSRICYSPLMLPADVRPGDLDAGLEDCFALCRRMLQKERADRLGGIMACAADVLADPFFAKLDLDDMMSKTVAPPLVPSLAGVFDLSYFDDEFTQSRPSMTD